MVAEEEPFTYTDGARWYDDDDDDDACKWLRLKSIIMYMT